MFGFFWFLIRTINSCFIVRESHQQQTNLAASFSLPALVFIPAAFKRSFALSTAARVSPLAIFFFFCVISVFLAPAISRLEGTHLVWLLNIRYDFLRFDSVVFLSSTKLTYFRSITCAVVFISPLHYGVFNV
jgi:hypothetical protein